MKLSYDPTTDMLRISFGERLEVEGFHLCDGIVVHLDAEEEVAGLGDRAGVRAGRLGISSGDCRGLWGFGETRSEGRPASRVLINA